ncbi:MAG: hypothetical protein AAAB36_11235 [Ensifer adhaerens]
MPQVATKCPCPVNASLEALSATKDTVIAAASPASRLMVMGVVPAWSARPSKAISTRAISDDSADHAKVYAALLEHCTLLYVQLEAGNDIAADCIGQALGITSDTRDRFAKAFSGGIRKVELIAGQHSGHCATAHARKSELGRLFGEEVHYLDGMTKFSAGLVQRPRNLKCSNNAGDAVEATARWDGV